ncbi:type II toxin-antitoxin system RelE/ParE family toxin [Oxalobacteraceae bacterium]|nr:type II toxin-antitoxin system RelE/ParE family toxin [Oxalobacteraceae bacterium]
MEFDLGSAAESDLQDIANYYSSIAPSLAERFLAEVEASLDDLCFEPAIGSRRYAHLLPDSALRTWHLDHFPFLVFYRIDGEVLSVLRVLHERRDLSASMISL